ncbi:DUF2529 domain-containing protein [Priestia koreensis]|uniref:DUF2529 domain-containing protein n=1 Tax=Priestia koreensis TaxID=284581 RepID=A0A0M0KFE2_9BACI|nr:DUF2529 domain-containing protein [Priestia koreensis]KOO37302.1 hypothetical protein AMD01_22815 [Priestia koreensis]
MLKIFTTQLSGYFKRIEEKEEFNIEDAARLLSQAIVGDGNVYVYGAREMKSVMFEALESEEPLQGAKPLLTMENLDNVTPADRVLLVSRFSDDQESIIIAKKLAEKSIPLVGMSALRASEDETLDQVVDVHIDTKLTKPLIPDEEGNRYGFPAVMTSLYAYYAVSLTMKEIISEYE